MFFLFLAENDGRPAPDGRTKAFPIHKSLAFFV
jgi:hypothetical protein